MSGPVNPGQPPVSPNPSGYPTQAPYGQPYGGFPSGQLVQRGPSKPASIFIFGIFHLVIAFFSFLWLAFLTAMLVAARSRMVDIDPQFDHPGLIRANRSNDTLLAIYEQTGYSQYQIFVIVFGAGLTLILIAAGILLLMGKEKGRDLSVSYSVASIILNVVSIAFQLFTGSMLANSNDMPTRVAQQAGMMVILGGLMLLGCLVYPALTFIFMTSRSVKEYLQRQ